MTDETPENEARRPRVGFLIAAGVFSALAFGAYLYEDEIIAQSPDGSPVPFAILLGMLVLVAMVLVLFYRVPSIGNRVLGYDIILNKTDKQAGKGYHFASGFKSESAVEEKRAASRRLSARQTRRKYARATRDMHAKDGVKANDTKPDEPKTDA